MATTKKTKRTVKLPTTGTEADRISRNPRTNDRTIERTLERMGKQTGPPDNRGTSLGFPPNPGRRS